MEALELEDYHRLVDLRVAGGLTDAKLLELSDRKGSFPKLPGSRRIELEILLFAPVGDSNHREIV